MNVTYSDKARQRNKDIRLLQEATNYLEEVLGQSVGLVQAEWDCTEDENGRILYTLQISDWTGVATAQFTPEELAIRTHMRYLLTRLWGDLLQTRNHKQLEALQKASDPEN